MYYPCSENKGAYLQLICDFVFAYADYWFSGAVAHFFWSKIFT